MAIVFIDLDGTLLENGRPAKNAILAIQKLKENGHLPVVATGRVPYLALDILKELNIDSYICASGSYIVYQNQLIHENPVPLPLIEKLFAYADVHQFDIVMEATNDYVAYRKNGVIADQFSDYFQVKRPEVVKDYHYHHPILAFNIFDDSVAEMLRKDFPEFIVSPAGIFGYDLNIKGDLKAEGMFFVVDYLHLHHETLYAIGDAHNDISMIQKADVGIAMGNAKKEVKDVADYITTSVTEGGVYDALVHFKLI